MYTSIFVKTLQSVAMATPPVAYVQPTVLTDNNEMTLSPKLAEDRESNPISWTTPHTANRRHLKILLCVSLAVVVLIVGVVSVLMCCHCGRCVSVKDAVPNDLQSQGSKMLGKMAAVKLPPKDAVMVWKTSDSVYYKQGRLDILPNGTIRVGDTGTYQVTAHICLDGYRMNTTLAKYNLHFDILSDPPQHLLPD
ncbi:uncharacterized protein LOC124262453 isoform X2 [Haliotis rubra]|uniref:uncharacterized protein LOC124262453 isoform X2 n=1 Tax=Haliotis rubra TaxID=36100 RepID=UPI001EE5D4FD|nr:uncharacterized protein LOC124262453 isoform X2 [Haliotis rubra]